MTKTIAQIVFSLVMLFLLGYSLVMIFVLLRHGKSKILSFVVSVFYVLLMLSIFALAVANFNAIPFQTTF